MRRRSPLRRAAACRASRTRPSRPWSTSGAGDAGEVRITSPRGLLSCAGMVEAPRLLQNRDFMLLWGGQVVSTLGSMASHVIFPLLILAMTDSPTAAGIAGALRFVP